MRGRKPIPDMLKRLHGTFQASRARHSPEAPDGPLQMPEQLAQLKHGVHYWNQITSAAPPGLLKSADECLLICLCRALAFAHDATEQLIEAGGPNPYDRRCKILARIVDQQTQIALRLTSDLGLTATARHFLG
jgi:hypothetical protein